MPSLSPPPPPPPPFPLPPLSQNIHAVYDSLLERDIKLHFLQILTPGAVYPDRVSKGAHIRSPGGSPDNGVEGDVESSIQVSHSKKFKMDKGGLPWETVETVHWFMYPGTLYVPFHDVCPALLGAMPLIKMANPFQCWSDTGCHLFLQRVLSYPVKTWNPASYPCSSLT